MARQGRAERLRACRAELSETSDAGAQGNQYLGRHARRLVRSLCTGAESAGGIRVACLEVHPRGPRWPAQDRVPASPADYLGQGKSSTHENALLVPARAVLVCAEEERS